MRRVLAIIVAAMLLAACGEGGGTSSEETSDSDTSTSEGTATGGDDSLADFFGYGSEDPQEAQAQYMDEEARRQELIRACMAGEGFDYTPVMPPEDSFQVWDPDDEEELAKTQGFGITTWYGNEEVFDSGVEWVDPNQEMVEAMSETEQQAYFEALYGTEEEQMEGTTTEIDPETGEEITYSEGFGAGCEGEASTEIWGDQSQTADLWEELSPEMDAMYERLQADPRILELDEQWAACMADAGHEYESRTQMYEVVFDDFSQRFEAIVGPNGGYTDPFEGWSQEEIDAFFEEKTEDEIEAFFEESQQQNQADIDQEALSALQQEERDVAVADRQCGAAYDEQYQEIAAEFEAEFIEANRGILEQIREAEGR